MPVTVTPGNTQTTVTLTITTKGGSVAPPSSPVNPPSTPLLRPLFGFSLAALLLALYAAFAIRRIPQLRRSAAIVPLALFLTAAILAGCASSGGTPKGTSTLTVTATSGTLSQNTTATLTVD